MNQDTVKIFGIRFDNVTMSDAIKRFVYFLKRDSTSVIYTPNPEIILTAQENSQLRQALLDGDLVVPDGVGVIMASKVHKLGLKERIGGVDLSEQMMKFLNNTKGSIYLLGATPSSVVAAADKLAQRYANIRVLGYHDGYFSAEDEIAIVDKINELKPDVVFVGLGSPAQEIWIDKYKRILNCKVAIGIGGGIDIWSGQVKRAPLWIQKIGLEWFYRLLQNPKRLSRVIKLPQFAYKVITTRRI